tara:strand:- start:959 stop:2530 length:1572 start_codon:yes stop_codon:yes gene_type:complete
MSSKSKKSKTNTTASSSSMDLDIQGNNAASSSSVNNTLNDIISTLDTATEINTPTFKPLIKKNNKDTINTIIGISDVEMRWCCYIKWLDTNQSEWIWADNKKEIEDTFKKPCKLVKKKQFPWKYEIESTNSLFNNIWVNANDVSESAIYNFEERQNHNEKVQDKVKNSNGTQSIHPKRAFLYARTSNPREASIEVQKHQMMQYCLQNNIEIDYLIEDNNVSGYYNKKYNTMNNLVSGRSNFADSYHKINNNHMVLVYKIDRLGRNSVCIEKILQGWQNRGIDFHSVLENVSYKLDIPENFAMNKIIIDQVRLAQEESDKKSRDLKKRHEIAKLEGKSLNCSAPYGFKKKKGKQIINFKEQKVIKHIIKQFKTFGSETNNYGFPISVEEIAAKVCKKMNNSTKYNNRRGSWRNKRIVDLFNNFKSNKTYLNARDPDKKVSKESNSSSSSSSSNSSSSPNSYYYQQKDQESTQEIHSRLKDLEEQLKTMREAQATNTSSNTQTLSANNNSSVNKSSNTLFSSLFG